MPTNLTAVLQAILQNTTNLKVLSQRMTPDATYVSLNFDNPELKKIKLNVTGREITSPFGLLAHFEGDKLAYVQFLEDSYGTAGSFKIGGATRFHGDPSGKEVEV
jgi:uncharacterized protein